MKKISIITEVTDQHIIFFDSEDYEYRIEGEHLAELEAAVAVICRDEMGEQYEYLCRQHKQSQLTLEEVHNLDYHLLLYCLNEVLHYSLNFESEFKVIKYEE